MNTNWCVFKEISMEIGMINFLNDIIGHCTDQRNSLYTILPIIWHPSQPWVHLHMVVQIYYRIWNCGKYLSKIFLCGDNIKSVQVMVRAQIGLYWWKQVNPTTYSFPHLHSAKRYQWKDLIYFYWKCGCYWCGAVSDFILDCPLCRPVWLKNRFAELLTWNIFGSFRSRFAALKLA